MYLVPSSLSLLPLPEISINLKGNSVQFLFPLSSSPFHFPISIWQTREEKGRQQVKRGRGGLRWEKDRSRGRKEGWERDFFVGKRKRYRIPWKIRTTSALLSLFLHVVAHEMRSDAALSAVIRSERARVYIHALT